MTSAYGTICPSAISYGFSQGYVPTWIVQSYNVNSKFVSLFGENAADGVISVAHLVREKTLGKDKKAWEDYLALMTKNKIPVSGTSVVGYTIAETFVETLKKAGKNLTRESILKAAESFDGWKCSLCLNELHSSSSNHWIFGPPKKVVLKSREWRYLE